MIKTILITSIMLAMSVLSLAQSAPQVKQFIFPASGDSISANVVITENNIPVAVWIDSLNTNTTLKFQIGFSRSRLITPTNFYDVCVKSDTIAYSINLRTNRYIPIEPLTFWTTEGTFMGESTVVYLRALLGADQTSSKILFVRFISL